jgi:hypothetical protein
MLYAIFAVTLVSAGSAPAPSVEREREPELAGEPP